MPRWQRGTLLCYAPGMNVEVTVHPKSRAERVVSVGETLHVYVRALPTEGEANRAAVRLLAEHFGVPKSSVALVHGNRGRRKLFKIGT